MFNDIHEGNLNKIAIFTGAGISAESGVPTFRDQGGLWTKYDVDQVCNIRNFYKNKKEVFEFFNGLKQEMISKKIQPNAAHYAIADLQSYYGHKKVTVFTSNVDMLLEEAGCSNVVHVHGDIEHSECLHCGHRNFIGENNFDVPCPNCDAGLEHIKPGVTFFYESAPKYQDLINDFHENFYFDEKTKLMENKWKLFIGTSFNVIPVSMFQVVQEYSVLVDLNPSELDSWSFGKVIRGKAAESAELFKNHMKSHVKK